MRETKLKIKITENKTFAFFGIHLPAKNNMDFAVLEEKLTFRIISDLD